MRTVAYLLLLVTLYAVPVLATVQAGADWDIWWHLRTGQWIVAHAEVPSTDPFSTYGHDRPWVAYSWLFEVLIYGLYCWLGLAGLLLYALVLSVAVTAALHRLIVRHEPQFLLAVVLTALGLLALSPLFKQRPWLFTILFTTLTLQTVLDMRESQTSWRTWLLPLLFALWANLHIQFVLGLLLLVLACVGAWLDSRGRRLPGQLLLLTLLCLAATFINPYGFGIYRVVFEYAMQPGPYQFINELKALEFRTFTDWMVPVLFGAAAFSLGRRTSRSWFDILLLIASAALAFRSRRDLWLLVLAACAILATARPFFRRISVPEQDRFDLTWWRTAILVVLIAELAALAFWRRDLSEERLEEQVALVFPVDAVNQVRQNGYPGPLLNDLNWGGYLIWALPELPVAIDGRTNLHGDARLQRSLDTWGGLPGWDDDPELASAGVVIANVNMPLTGLLLRDRRFVLVYQDHLALVFVSRQTVAHPKR
jgi:hypothetical protein